MSFAAAIYCTLCNTTVAGAYLHCWARLVFRGTAGASIVDTESSNCCCFSGSGSGSGSRFLHSSFSCWRGRFC
jgi:hypothetical protein